MTFDEFKHQLPDIYPAETDEWLASFDQLVAQEGEGRARFLVYKLLKRARQLLYASLIYLPVLLLVMALDRVPL
jgi:pyruvate dehydrogenase complex dehydrogenase (E1) component